MQWELLKTTQHGSCMFMVVCSQVFNLCLYIDLTRYRWLLLGFNQYVHTLVLTFDTHGYLQIPTDIK
jgi:hypothetical protein